MTDSSKARKNKKITYAASTQSIERAENALRRLGFESKSNFAQSQLISRSTVTKFFQGQPIQLDSFKRICKALKLNWAEIAGIIEEGQSENLGINSYSSLDTEQVVEQVQVSHRKVTVIDKETKETKVIIVLEGDINSINNNLKVSLELMLKTYPGDTIKIVDIQPGSIRLIVEGSQEDIKLLVSRIESGELTELNGFPVEDIQILNESLDNDESNELDNKWRLVKEIVNQRVKGRKLRGVDLSDADLSGTDLSRADLSGADLSGADLRSANLSGANLSGANLSDANLSDANLSGANLSGANLSGANLSDADLSGVNLSSANLSGANLSSTNLRGADLSDSDLSGADLSIQDVQLVNTIPTKTAEEQQGFATSLLSRFREEGYSWVELSEILDILELVQQAYLTTQEAIEAALSELLYPDFDISATATKQGEDDLGEDFGKEDLDIEFLNALTVEVINFYKK